MRRYFSLGDISTSRFWISFERRPLAFWRWGFSLEPTYKGTTAGLYIALPFCVILGHVRDLKAS